MPSSLSIGGVAFITLIRDPVRVEGFGDLIFDGRGRCVFYRRRCSARLSGARLVHWANPNLFVAVRTIAFVCINEIFALANTTSLGSTIVDVTTNFLTRVSIYFLFEAIVTFALIIIQLVYALSKRPT
jgi:hypothetical protein